MSKENDKLVCEFCNREFKSEGYLRQHLLFCKEKTKEDTGDKKTTCPDCGAVVRKLNLDNQEEYFLYRKGYNYICDSCEEVLNIEK